MKLDKNLKHFEKAEKLIPLCSQTFSKAFTQYSFGQSPIFAEKADGCYLWDVDGNRFIDYVMGLGAVMIGYNCKEINKAVENQLKKGIAFTLPHKLEADVAHELIKIFPSAEMVRFGKNGSDATSGAVRLARAFTKRERVAICGYHGWHDWFIATTTRNAGIPESTKELSSTFTYNNIESLEALFKKYPGEIAAVIMEPIGVEFPKDNFLEKVKALTHTNGALLIFDEIVTGFRIALGGGQEYFNVVPDITTIGKGMANGMPISSIIGNKEIMKKMEEIFFSFTFGGEALSLAATIASIDFFKKKNVTNHIYAVGKQLMVGVKALLVKHRLVDRIGILGYPPRQAFTFTPSQEYSTEEIKTLIQELCHERGLLFLGVHNLSYSHTPKIIQDTINIYDQVFSRVAEVVEKRRVRSEIKGRVIEPVFRKV